MKKLLLLFLILLSLSCSKKPKFSIVPKITYNSLQPQILQAGSSNGGTTISFYFEDGDGDIGFGTYNLYIKDSRDSSIALMKIPEIPSAYSPQNGIKGLITVDYLSALLTLRPDTAHINSDTLRWAIYIKDKAGHQSNTILTDSLYLFK